MSDSAVYMHLSLHKHIHVSSLKAHPALPLAIAAMQVICTLTHITWCIYLYNYAMLKGSFPSFLPVRGCVCMYRKLRKLANKAAKIVVVRYDCS